MANTKKRKMPDDEAETQSSATNPNVQPPEGTESTDTDAAAGPAGLPAKGKPSPDLPRPHYRPVLGTPRDRNDSYFRQLYDSEPNFWQLGKQDPLFAGHLNKHGQLNFNDPAAMMQLTKTLLKQHFDLKVELPHDRLCPPVPNRHNYILWLKDLMDTTSYAPPGRKLCGLDVGTGASCIYPLLGTAQRPWCFVATDIDAKSLSYAQKNIELNQLSDRIRLIKRESPSDPLVPLDDIGVESIDFVMMNPPFYTSEDEMLSSAKKKERPPHSACTGAPVEMVCDGGEVAYVGRMVRESLVLRERVQWYTTMLGKVTSLDALVEQLRENGIDNYAVTEFVQGNKTRRWALGWSFGAMRPEEQVARGMTPAPYRKILPPVVSMELLKLGPDKLLVEPVMKKINELVGKLELISWTWEGSAQRGVGRARENVWSRAWRRKKAKEKTEGKTSATFSAPNCHDKVVKEEQCRFGFVIEITIKQWGSKVLLRWVEGHDQALFESFGGFLQRELKECAV